MSLILAGLTIIIALFVFKVLTDQPGPTAEKVALGVAFGIYSLGIANATLTDYFNPEPRTNIERPDRTPDDWRPGCDPLPRLEITPENDSGVRIIACT